MIREECERIQISSRPEPIIDLEAVREAFMEITDLVARVFEIEFQLDQVKEILLRELERAS